jgi:DNA-binding transcriptional LysR family regulator
MPVSDRGAKVGVDRTRDAGTASRPTLDELEAFVHLARALHFGRAATRLGVARSSLSETIRRLEHKLEAVLFERTSRRVALTDAGARLLPRARVVIGGVAVLQSAAAADSRPETGSVRIGLEANGFAELTQPILATFRARYPGTVLILREFAGAPQSFFDSNLDVALTRSPIVDDRLEVHEMAIEPRGVLVSTSHPRAGTGGASIVDFLDDAFVAVMPPCRDYWIAQEHRGGERPRIGGEAFTVQDVLSAVAHLGLVTTAGRSIPRSFPLPGVAFAGVGDLSPIILAVAVRAGERRPMVTDFIELVRGVVARFAETTPDITVMSIA